MADDRTKAMAALRSGRVKLRAVISEDGKAVRVEAEVASTRPNRPPHVVDLWRGDTGWSCTCRAGTDFGGDCAHQLAVRLVTGHATAEDGRA